MKGGCQRGRKLWLALGLAAYQGGQGVHRAAGVAAVEAPEAEPVARFAGDRFEGFRLLQQVGDCGGGVAVLVPSARRAR